MIQSIDTLSPTIGTRGTSVGSPSSEKKERMRGAQVETTAGWREITRGDRSARLQEARIVQSKYYCQLCGIYIGPGYYEQEMYLWFVPPGRNVYNARRNCCIRHKEWMWIRLCGGCACYKDRRLPPWMKVLTPECWTTTLLLDEEGPVRPVNTRDPGIMLQILDAIARHLKRAPFLLTNKLISLSSDADASLLALRDHLLPQQQEKKDKQRKKAQAPERRAPAEGEQHLLFPKGEDLFLSLVTVDTPFL